MGSTAVAALPLILLLATFPAVFAVTFRVGDESGWTSGMDYTTWVTGKTFRIGDTLEFVYGPSHSVSVVDKTGYEGCDSSGATQTLTGGNNKFDLETVGTIHFLCPTFGHCLGGMKLAVPVLAAAPSSPPSPPSSPKPSPSSPPSSPNANPTSPLASPPANGTPEYETLPPPSPPSAGSKGVMSYGMIGVSMVLMYGLMS